MTNNPQPTGPAQAEPVGGPTSPSPGRHSGAGAAPGMPSEEHVMSPENRTNGSTGAQAPAANADAVPDDAGRESANDSAPTSDNAATPAGAHRAGPATGSETNGAAATPGLGAELQALRTELDERVRDLQRVTAEYANYRKRVDRDRALVGEQATGNVINALLPILDDLDRAREHGDLVGPFATVAEQLTAALTKFGLSGFGEPGEKFDPTRHEAVAHATSAEVTEPTCVNVMRRGYQLGERLLRPAMVSVAEPE